MTPQKFATEMLKLSVGESPDARPFAEWAHAEMEDLMVQVLRELGYGAGCDFFEAIPK